MEGNEKFTITVDAEIEEYEATIEVDLTDPKFEPQVMAAAGHFRSRRRTRLRGATPKPVICPECRELVRTTNDLPRHRREDCSPVAGQGGT